MPLNIAGSALRVAALLLLGTAAWPAGAAAIGDPPAACRELTALIGPDHALTASSVEAVGQDGCLVHDPSLSAGIRYSYKASSLLVRGLPPGPRPGPLPSLNVQVELRGIVFAPETASPAADWMIRQQQVPFDLTVDGGYDAAAYRLVLRNLLVDGTSLGHFSASASLVQVALAFPLDGSDVGQTAMDSLRVEFDSRRALVGYTLPLILGLLPAQDPGGGVDRAKAAIEAAMRRLLPASGLSASSIEALAGFVRDFPNPQHGISLSVSADPPAALVPLMQAAGDPETVARQMLPHIRGTASYAGPLP